MRTVGHDRRVVPEKVIHQDLRTRQPINVKKFHVDPSAALPEEDAEGINPGFRHDDVEGRVRVVRGTSVLTARAIPETEQGAQGVARIRGGSAGPSVVHVQT